MEIIGSRGLCFGYGWRWVLHRIGLHRFCWKKQYKNIGWELHCDLPMPGWYR